MHSQILEIFLLEKNSLIKNRVLADFKTFYETNEKSYYKPKKLQLILYYVYTRANYYGFMSQVSKNKNYDDYVYTRFYKLVRI